MLFFENVGFDEPLPVQAQNIHVTFAFKADAAAPGAGHQPQVYFGVMPQGFVMANANCGFRDGFQKNHPAIAETHVQAVALLQKLRKYVQLNFAHHPDAEAGRIVFHA